MKCTMLAQQGASTLAVFFTGWGMDARPFARIGQSAHVRHCDVALCYDYTDMQLPLPACSGYAAVQVWAWSLGVYAASVVLAATNLPITRAVAINGTLFPVDDTRGIPTATYDATLRALTGEAAASVLERFTRRMCGRYYADFTAHMPARSLTSLRDELAAVKAHAATRQSRPYTAWNLAVLSRKDRIFPIANLRRAWADTPRIELNEPHYLPDLPFVGE